MGEMAQAADSTNECMFFCVRSVGQVEKVSERRAEGADAVGGGALVPTVCAARRGGVGA